jgi:Isochorismatase family
MAASAGSVWVASAGDQAKVTRIDARTPGVTTVIGVPGVALDVATGFGSIWATTLRGTLLRIDPKTNRIAAKLRLGDAGLTTTAAVSSGSSIARTGASFASSRPGDSVSRMRDSGEIMATLGNRPNTALLVVDVQKGVVEGAHERDAVVANVGSLVEKARRERVPVVWVQHSDEQLVRGSDDWRIVPELAPNDSEPLVEKSYGDSFEDTSLEAVLSGLGVGRLVVVGAETDACVRSTLHGALVRGYDATLVSDAHTMGDRTAWGAPPPDQVIAHTNLYWTYQTAPGRTAGTVETKDVDFGRPGLRLLS